ncbi:type II secretion system protein [bacterium]|nr:type II secretion system protein [bacterium]
MKFNSYIVSETKTAFSVPLQTHLLTSNKTFKQKAFTLAETLITLSIIGVVAAMTVPTLMSNMNKQTYVTGLKKAHSVLTNAIQMIPESEGCGGDYVCSGFIEPNNKQEALYSFTKDSLDLLSKQLKGKLIEDCSDIIGNRPYITSKRCIQTEDGMVIYRTGPSYNDRIIAVDINGKKGPNNANRDIWAFFLKNVGEINENSNLTLIPQGQTYNYSCENGAPYVNKNSSYDWDAYCTYEVLKTGKMDY